MIRLNYGCDKRVRYCALIFAADIVPSLSTIQWDLKKSACESTEGSAKPLKKKNHVKHKSGIFLKRPSTDFDKNYIFGIGSSSAIEWYLSFLLSISWPTDEPWLRLLSVVFYHVKFHATKLKKKCANLPRKTSSILLRGTSKVVLHYLYW